MKKSKVNNKLTYSVCLFVCLFVVVLGCRKDRTVPSLSKPSFSANPASKLKAVPQATYELNSGQVVEIVKSFREQYLKDAAMASRLIDADSVAVDSALWTLEAMLNFEFDLDLQGGYEIWRTDTIEFDIATDETSSMINSNDLEKLYDDFRSILIDSATSDFGLRCIDIQGFNYDPGIGQMKVIGVAYKYSASHPADCPTTGPFPTNATYKPMTNHEYNVFLAAQCGTSGNTSAIDELNIYKNCRGTTNNCSTPQFTGFYINISQGYIEAGIYPSSNPFPNELYCSGFQSPYSWWCTDPGATITGSQLNTFLANQITFANNIVSPLQPISRTLSSKRLFQWNQDPICNCQVGWPCFYWRMDIVYGKFVCVENDN